MIGNWAYAIIYEEYKMKLKKSTEHNRPVKMQGMANLWESSQQLQDIQSHY